MNLQSVDQFKRILDQFVKFNVTTGTKETHKQLQSTIHSFTKTQQCWDIILKIIQNQTDGSVLILASNILKNKLLYDFSQLNSDMFQKIHQSIFKITSKHKNPSNSLRINLCVSIAIIYIHKIQDLGQLFAYLLKQFSQTQNKNYVFTVLQVLPEEIDNDKLVIDEQQRNKLKTYMKQIQKSILVQLNNISTNTWETEGVKHQILMKCFSNWIKIGLDKQVVKSIHSHFLLQKAFMCLNSVDLGQQCYICIQNVIKQITNPQQQFELYTYLARQVIGFFLKISQLIRYGMFESCEFLVKIVCLFGISSKRQFISNANQDYIQFINNVVFLTEQTELGCQIFINQFWVEFLQTMIQNTKAMQFYKQNIKQLYLVMSKNLCLGLKYCKTLNEKLASDLQKNDQQFQFKVSYRIQSKSLFNLISNIISPQICLSLTIDALGQLKSEDVNFWPTMQSLLNPLQQVLLQLSSPSDNLNSLLNKIVQINTPYKVIQKTIIRLLSSCSNVYSDNNQFSLKIFQHLMQFMKNPEMIPISSNAFQNLCSHNVQFVVLNISSFMQTLLVYKQNQKILIGIIKAIQTNRKVLEETLPKIFSLYQKDLVDTFNIKSAKQTLQKFVFIFNSLTTDNISSNQQIIGKQFSSLWLMIKPIIEKQCKTIEDESLIEKCTKVIKYSMRCLKQFFQPYVQDVFNTIIQSYQKYPLGSYVYMVEIFISVYNENTQFINYITNLFDKTCQISFIHLSTMEKVQSHPKLTEDFFGLISRLLKLNPQFVFSSQYFNNLFNFIVECSGIEDGPVAKIFYRLLVDFYKQYWAQNYIEEERNSQNAKQKFRNKSQKLKDQLQNSKSLIVQKSLSIIQKMFTHLESVPSTTIRNNIIDSLLSQIKAFSTQNRNIWIQILMPIKDDILTVNQKAKILQSVTVLNTNNLNYVEDMFYLIGKRYMHKQIRSPIY